MGHSHDGHSHGHDHSHGANKTALMWSFILIFGFMIVEVVGGIITNSLALLSDAGHMLSDAAALGLSLVAFKVGERSATKAKTYGYKRFEILAAFLNGVTLIVISLYIFWEAYNRFLDPPNVSMGMMIVAFIGLVVNILVAWILMRGDTEENLNLRSAFLHVLGDLLGSIGAIIAGILIYFFNWNIADPIASVLVALLIITSGYRIAKDSFHVLMEGKPEGINVEKVHEDLKGLANVVDVHDLHIWSITNEFPALTCHLVVDKECERDLLLQKAVGLLKSEHEITHSTIQIESQSVLPHEKDDCCN
ncbi:MULTISPECIES: cation diffusion facilitator family transporter [Pontibacillus]|uniref:Cation diffusion facilitator family transporter n=1 Tax=Pontibacillus chungwhensis TaxID=265426 RepID=A0ABY8V2A4_9BACI|nr:MULTISPECIES: cation diffusion facilitator family transporter [Pontibacillus]MCD5322498.1 cation diffusion facilitator family transporter [Pontibacillus sp. HN14]WIF99783.1 cation diffusion facilitator family transporter [Pontibacillus chungwhensis]